MPFPIDETITPVCLNDAKKRPTIGYITQHAYDGIGLRLLTGVYDAARDYDLNLINVVGGSTLTYHEVNQAEITAIKLLNSKSIDGLISWASSLRYYMNINELEEFHHRFKPLPIVSIAMPMKGIPAVLVDNRMGMEQVLEHLIKNHGCRRIAFIRGEEEHFYSEERFQGYLHVLAGYQIPYDANLVVSTSDISTREGVRAISVLLDERKLRPGTDFDAIASVSDVLSIAAMEELRSRGFQAPRDLAVVGFNNRKESCLSSPPLTTVETDIYHHGYNSVKSLLALLQGYSIPDQILSSTRLVIRQSCGCFESTVINAAIRHPLCLDGQAHEGPWREQIVASYSVIIADIQECLPNFRFVLPDSWAEELFDAFLDYLENDSVNSFLNLLNKYLSLWRNERREFEAWENVISELRRRILGLVVEPHLIFRVENALHQARALIFVAREYSPVFSQYKSAFNPNDLAQLGGIFNSSLDINELLNIIMRELPKLGIPGCYLSLYVNPSKPEEAARLILAFNQSGRIEPSNPIYSSSELLPEGILPKDERYCLLAESCYHKDHQLGLVIFEMGPLSGSLYEILRTSFSSALYGVLVMEGRIKAERDREVLVKALEANNRELEERNNDIKNVNEQLKVAIEEAIRANQAKSTFLTNMSHEIRTPLNCILGFAEVAATVEKPDGTSYYLDLITEESEKLLELINQLLDISKIEAGKFKIQNEPFDLVELMESLTSTFAASARNKGLEFNLQLAEDLPHYLKGDSLRLRQILVNLIGNAIKFTHQGGIDVTVEVKREAFSEVALYFQIKDTGIGIPKDRQEEIFETFVQAESSTTRKYGGTGLGTAIAKQLSRLMGGEIGLVSEKGVGSTFWFTVVMNKTLPIQGPQSKNNSEPMEVPDLKRRISILIAEDYPPNQKVVLAHLAGQNFEITIAENGRRAIEKFHEKEFDLILMDIQMPEMDGFEASGRIRMEPGGATIPIIAMTANAFEADIKKCFESGMNDVITKPFRKKLLIEKIVFWANCFQKAKSSNEELNFQEFNNTDEPIHIQKTLDEFGGDRELLFSVIDEYIANVHQQTVKIAEAIQNRLYETVWREAHSIKGGALNLAAEALAEIAFELEKSGKSGDSTKSSKFLSKMVDELVRLEIYVGYQRQRGTAS